MGMFLIKSNLVILAATAISAFLTYLVSNKLWYNYNRDSSVSQPLLEQGLNFALKAFAFFILLSSFALAVSLPIITYYMWTDIQSLPGETPIFITIAMAILSISGLIAFVLGVQRKHLESPVNLPVDHINEPELYSLVNSLQRFFEISDIKSIRITPGSEITVREHVETFDHVFYSGDKIVEIGLSSMELLSASDLKVLLARQFAQYVENDSPPIALIKRLKVKLAMMNDNILSGGFLLTLNPVAWVVMASAAAIDWLTSDYQAMAEYKIDQVTIEYSGVNRLSHALARYGVETELYKELIGLVDSRDRANRIPFEGNIYDSMRRAQAETTDQLRVMVDHLFSDSALSGGDIGKKTLKLRLNRLPETPTIPTMDVKRPALAYLKDWRSTENRMIKLLRS